MCQLDLVSAEIRNTDLFRAPRVIVESVVPSDQQHRNSLIAIGHSKLLADSSIEVMAHGLCPFTYSMSAHVVTNSSVPHFFGSSLHKYNGLQFNYEWLEGESFIVANLSQ